MSRAVLLLICAVTLGAVIFLDLPGGLRWSQVVQNWAHAPAFAVLAWGFLSVLTPDPARRPPPRSYGAAGLSALLLGIAVEIVQHFMNRDADALDVLQDTFGIVAALSVHALWRGLSSWPLRFTAAIATVWACAPLVSCAVAYAHRSWQFPVIVDFRSSLDLYFLRKFDPPVTRVSLPAKLSHGTPEISLFAPSGDHPWPGVVFEEPPPDWKGYRTLVIDVANPNPSELAMILTVHDRQYDGTPADRFDREFRVPPGQRLVLRTPLDQITRGPRSRTLDLSSIWRMAIAQERGSRELPGFFLNGVWLE